MSVFQAQPAPDSALEEIPNFGGLQWLPLALPAHAQRIRVSVPAVAVALADAGANLADEQSEADVEIAATQHVVGDTDVAIVVFNPRAGDWHRLRIARAVTRAALWASCSLQAARAAKALRRKGYESTEVVRWDFSHSVLHSRDGGRRRLSEYLPQRAFVVGRRGDTGPTIFEDALEQASGVLGEELTPRNISTRAGFVLALGDRAVLRVTVGPSRGQLEAHVRALESLRELAPPPDVDERVPALLGGGRDGLADWIVEERLRGSVPQPDSPSGVLRDDCIDFLAVLHAIPGSDVSPTALETAADTIARFCRPQNASVVRAVAVATTEDVAGLPRGFGHGDFFPGNVLVQGGRLSGVLDWDAGGPGRLPLVDLLHFRLHLEHQPSDTEWGPAILKHLVPWAERGGDAMTADYLERIGARADAVVLRALVIAYWLERTAYQLRTHRIRRHQPRWLERNVDLVLEQLGRDVADAGSSSRLSAQ